MNYFTIQIIVMLTIASATSSEAASITTNGECNLVCPGEELIIICTGEGTFQRWTVLNYGGETLAHHTFQRDHQQRTFLDGNYHFTLISTAEVDDFVSTFSTVATNDLNEATVECVDVSSPDRTTIKIEDMPCPPENLSIISVEHHSNYSTCVVMWEPASNDLHVDFYQYQLINSLTEVRASNTSNTTAILSDVPYNVNISFVISAYNCERESEQATLIIKIIDPTYAIVRTAVLNTPTQTLSSVSALETLSGTSSPKLNEAFLLFIYIITAAVGTILCVLAGLIAACICKAALAKKRVKIKSTTDSSSGEHDDIVGPVYDTISPSDSSVCDGKVSMTENEAYKSFHFKETTFTSLAGDVSNNEANCTPGSAPIVMEKNSSYQTTVPRRLVATNRV